MPQCRMARPPGYGLGKAVPLPITPSTLVEGCVRDAAYPGRGDHSKALACTVMPGNDDQLCCCDWPT